MKLSKHSLRLLTLATILLLALSAVAFAQETTGRISGQVVDPAGAIVSNAEVTLTNTATRDERKVQTDDNGNFVLTQLQPGNYDLAVRGQGFKEYINKGFDLNVNDRKMLNIALETGAVSETVTVLGKRRSSKRRLRLATWLRTGAWLSCHSILATSCNF